MKNINPYSDSYLLCTKYQSLYELFIKLKKKSPGHVYCSFMRINHKLIQPPMRVCWVKKFCSAFTHRCQSDSQTHSINLNQVNSLTSDLHKYICSKQPLH